MRRLPLLSVLAVLMLTWVASRAQDRLAPLESQTTIVTREGRVYRGWLDGYRHERVRLRIPADRGEVIYQFSADEIRSLVFPGSLEADEALAALQSDPLAPVLGVLEDTWSVRSAFLPALNRTNRAPLIAYAEALLQRGRPIEAIARGRRLNGLALDTDEREKMDAVVMVGHANSGLLEEASVLAEAWCREHKASGSSALGWALLARQALRTEAWEDALWLSLHPVAFGHDATATGLDVCYGAAVAASLRLENAEQAVALFNEMRERGIDWPKREPLLKRASSFLEEAMIRENQSTDDVLADEMAGPPIPDPKLTLEAVRRLLVRTH